jgi:hypothetical protein
MSVQSIVACLCCVPWYSVQHQNVGSFCLSCLRSSYCLLLLLIVCRRPWVKLAPNYRIIELYKLEVFTNPYVVSVPVVGSQCRSIGKQYSTLLYRTVTVRTVGYTLLTDACRQCVNGSSISFYDIYNFYAVCVSIETECRNDRSPIQGSTRSPSPQDRILDIFRACLSVHKYTFQEETTPVHAFGGRRMVSVKNHVWCSF